MKKPTYDLAIYTEEATRTDLPTEQYVDAARRLANIVRLEHAGHGIVTEVGELMDTLKRHIYYGVPLDVVNLKEEAGDLMWYIAILLDELSQRFGITDVLAANIEKLKQRYPNKFSEEDAVNRDVAKERTVIEGEGDGESEDKTDAYQIIINTVWGAVNSTRLSPEQLAGMLTSLGKAFKWLARQRPQKIQAVAFLSDVVPFELVIYAGSSRHSF